MADSELKEYAKRIADEMAASINKETAPESEPLPKESLKERAKRRTEAMVKSLNKEAIKK